MVAPAVERSEVVQIVLTGALYPALRDWLYARGLTLGELPVDGDDLRTLMVGVGDKLWRETGG